MEFAFKIKPRQRPTYISLVILAQMKPKIHQPSLAIHPPSELTLNSFKWHHLLKSILTASLPAPAPFSTTKPRAREASGAGEKGKATGGGGG